MGKKQSNARRVVKPRNGILGGARQQYLAGNGARVPHNQARKVVKNHQELNAGFREGGEGIANAPSDNLPTRSLKSTVKRLPVNQIVRNQFAAKYRRAQPQHDEIVPTSAVSNVVQGVQKVMNRTQPAAAAAAIDTKTAKEVNRISEVRAPTKDVGFEYKDDPGNFSQHPAPPGKAIFGRKGMKGNQHSQLDRERKQIILEDLKGAQAQNLSLERQVDTVIATGIAFTVNRMMAPAAAGNMTARGTPAERQRQMEHREDLKDHAVALGAPRRGRGRQAENADWEGEKVSNVRSISPSRRSRK